MGEEWRKRQRTRGTSSGSRFTEFVVPGILDVEVLEALLSLRRMFEDVDGVELTQAVECTCLSAERPVAMPLVESDLSAGRLDIALPLSDPDFGARSHLPLELRLPGLVDADSVDEGTLDLLPTELRRGPDVAGDLVVRLELIEVRSTEDASGLVLEDEDLPAELHEAVEDTTVLDVFEVLSTSWADGLGEAGNHIATAFPHDPLSIHPVSAEGDMKAIEFDREGHFNHRIVWQADDSESLRGVELRVLNHRRDALLLRTEVINRHIFRPAVIDGEECTLEAVGLIPLSQAQVESTAEPEGSTLTSGCPPLSDTKVVLCGAGLVHCESEIVQLHGMDSPQLKGPA